MYKGDIYYEMESEFQEISEYIKEVTKDNKDLYDEVESSLYLDLESVGEDLGINVWNITLDKLIDILYDNKLL